MSAPVDAALAAQLAELSRALERTDLSAALEHVAGLSAALVPGAVAASVTLWRDGAPYTFAASTPDAREVDEAQYDEHAGPCITAAGSGELVLVDDLATHEHEWPTFSQEARKRDLHSALALPLDVGTHVVGALNLYGARTGAFDRSSQELARLVARHGATVAVNAAALFEARELAGQLQEAMQSRAVIDQAIGIVMGTQRVGSAEAFQVLVRRSQNTNRPVREVAAELVAQTSTPPA